MSKVFDKDASYVNFEEKCLMDELKAFRKYEPAYIHIPFGISKVVTFRKMIEREYMEYKETENKNGGYHVFLRTDDFDLR
jgi:hypothetical protein